VCVNAQLRLRVARFQAANMEVEPAAGTEAVGSAPAAVPVVRSFTFTPISGDWADDAEDEEDGEGREGARASALEQLKEKYQHRCASAVARAARMSARTTAVGGIRACGAAHACVCGVAHVWHREVA
jgi:hypothetical protein